MVFSSLSGEYIHVVVQVTRDGVPVVCSLYKLPVEGLDLGVADLTVEQFLALAKAKRSELPLEMAGKDLSSSEWQKLLRQTTTTLENLLKVSSVTLLTTNSRSSLTCMTLSGFAIEAWPLSGTRVPRENRSATLRYWARTSGQRFCRRRASGYFWRIDFSHGFSQAPTFLSQKKNRVRFV